MPLAVEVVALVVAVGVGVVAAVALWPPFLLGSFPLSLPFLSAGEMPLLFLRCRRFPPSPFPGEEVADGAEFKAI